MAARSNDVVVVPVSPLPWRREPYSGSTDSWIADADGKDICRVSGPEARRHTVAIRDRDAAAIVAAVNALGVHATDDRDLVRRVVDELPKCSCGRAAAFMLPDGTDCCRGCACEFDEEAAEQIYPWANALLVLMARMEDW